MLASRVGNIPGAVGRQWNGIATTCHFATVFWLFWDEFNRPPTQNDFLTIGDPTLVVRRMLPLGKKLGRPRAGGLILTPGSIVVFVHNGQPVHSCVAITANTLGGYNQAGWFTGPGVDHGYSVHDTSEIRWRGGMLHGDDVQGNVGQWCRLTVIGEQPAKAIIRQIVQG
ncbi:MAG: hypothetical protein D6736_03140 [Nitrospinota bacterium]|nr:MAG: hypothetical protein D6736_03140 [Nitrospinota bacterium]